MKTDPLPRTIEGVRRSYDADRSKRYRLEDEDIVRRSDSFRHWSSILQELTESARSPIDVLDAGCGSGRHFHCLKNVRRLVGVDISPDMLEQAKQPVFADQIEAERIELYCGEVHTAPLEAASFDLIYSIGVYGELSPLDSALLQRLASLLRPGGTLFITSVDSRSRVAFPESGRASLTRRLMRKGFPLLPGWVRERVNSVLSPYYLSRSRLEQLLSESPFRQFEVSPYRHISGWRGTHWDCLARK